MSAVSERGDASEAHRAAERSDDARAVLEDRVLILAPLGRDAALAQQVATAAKLRSFACKTPRELFDEVTKGAGALLITEEALAPGIIERLQASLAEQPPWSDLAVIVCASQGAALEGRFEIVDKLRATASITLIERPVRKWMLATALTAAVRARRRQYEMRDLHQERDALLARERTARAHAEDANRAKDEFLAMVSHELRTPLNAILGWTRILRARATADAQHTRGLQIIERNAEAQRLLIEELLDVSRVLANELRLTFRSVRLRGIVESAIDRVRPTVDSKSLELECAWPDEDVVVLGDADRLLQIVSNLLTNAVKFTPKQGRVRVSLVRDGDSAVVEVVDDGEGIDPAFMPHVFDRFRQADGGATRRHGGMGLGLTITRALVELHGGTIRAESRGKGHGARFTVRIPRVTALAAAVRGGDVAPSLDCPARLHGMRVLVVDDEPDALEMLELALTTCGLVVTTATSAEEARTVIAARPPDILLADIGMPEEDGYALIRSVRALPDDRGGRMAAIALTAFARAEDKARAMSAGYDGHIAKPVEFAELFRAMVDAVET